MKSHPFCVLLRNLVDGDASILNALPYAGSPATGQNATNLAINNFPVVTVALVFAEKLALHFVASVTERSWSSSSCTVTKKTKTPGIWLIYMKIGGLF